MPVSRLSPDEVDFIMVMKKFKTSNCDIAKKLGVTEGAVRYRIKRRESGKKDGRKCRRSCLDRYRAIITHWIASYEEDKKRPPLKKLYETLWNQYGYRHSYDAVRRYVRKHFPKFWKKGLRIRVETPPGVLMQIDWKEDLRVQMGVLGRWIKVQALIFTPGFSRRPVVKIRGRKDLNAFINAHQAAFRDFGGLPEVIRPDCLKSAVIQWRGGKSVINPTYRRYLSGIGVSVFPSRPGYPEDKGKVEKRIQDVFSLLDFRHRVFKDMADLEHYVETEVERHSHTWRCGATGQTVAESFAYEKKYFKPLPETFPLLPLKERLCRVRRDGTVYFDYNYYQLPRDYVDHTVLCINSGTEIRIYHDGRLIRRFPYLPQAKGMVMMSEAALLDEAIHLSDTVRAWGLEVARRQVTYYQEILRGSAR